MHERIRFSALIVTAFLMASPVAQATEYQVTNTLDSGRGSLRGAIESANNHAGYDVITFNIPLSDPGHVVDNSGAETSQYWRIALISPLPAITETVLIDGTSQPYDSPLYDNPVIVIDGQNAGLGASGLLITGSDITVQKIAVVNFDEAGIEIEGRYAHRNIILDCWSGVLPANPLVAAPNFYGVWIKSADNIVEGSLVSGNAWDGILIEGASVTNISVRSSRIGTGPDGWLAPAIANGGNGIHVDGASQNYFGGVTANMGNRISGNALAGMLITGDQNQIGLSWIGTDAANGTAGVSLVGSQNQVGYLNLTGTSRWGPTISGNTTNGVEIGGSYNSVFASVIGLTVDGSAPHPNGGHGVLVRAGASYTSVGRDLYSGSVNFISGNAMSGVYIEDGATETYIYGNYIGVGEPPEDNVAIGNGEHGVHLAGDVTSSSVVWVGTTATGQKNVISGNGSIGVFMNGSGNTIQGNHIGTNEAGDVAMPNSIGITISGYNNAIQDNLISGNEHEGIRCDLCSGSITGNKIGTDLSGDHALGNGSDGIVLFGTIPTSARVGGIVPGEANTIAYNRHGVRVGESYNDAPIRGNRIFGNAARGIELYPLGVNANDVDDVDTGANNKMNYPELAFANYIESSSSIGVLYDMTSHNDHAPRPIEVDFYLADESNQEGRTYLGTHTYTHLGKQAETASLAVSTPPEHNMIVATATDANGNTSEFSPPILLNGVESVTVDVKVFLQGAYREGSMVTDLWYYGDVPVDQPYSDAPWYYAGQEGDEGPHNTVDWVLVGLRTNEAQVASRAGYLRSNGSIVDLDGASPLTFSGVAPGSYRVTVFHRNHLAIMSSTLIDFSVGSGSWDFTTSWNKAHGYTDAMVDLSGTGAGPWGMFAGDADADGDVDGGDFILYQEATTLGVVGYEPTDLNLDGKVQALDANLCIENAAGSRSSQVP